MTATAFPELIAEAQTSEEQFLRHIFVRDQMQEWSKAPLIMARADGVHYWDVTGKRYLDALSGIYTVSLGHNNRRVIEAAKKQLDTLHFSPPMHGTNPVAVQLANLLAELAPGDLGAVKFQCGGSEVTEAAMKLARQYHRLTGNPGKYKVMSRYQAWHGSTMGALAAGGLKSRKTVNEPMPAGFVKVFPPTCYRCPFGQKCGDCGTLCATIVEQVVDMEDPATVAAIMVEPIGHTGGIIDPPPEYLPILRDICDRHNIILIFDEIITGIGRTGHMFAADTFGVVPDVICTAKGMSGGFAPLSAMICRQKHADAFWGPIAENPGFVEGHTFEGNPLSCAVGIAVIREIVERDICANVRTMGARLRQNFEKLAAKHGIIGDIRGKGLLQGIEFVKDLKTKEQFPGGIGVKIGRRALANGLLCRFDPHWIAFGPALVSTAEQIDEMVALLDKSMGEVLGDTGEKWGMRYLSDTRPEADAVLTRVFREMPPGKKLRLLGQCYADARALHAGGFRMRNPSATKRDILADWLTVNLNIKNLPTLREPEEIMPLTSLRDLHDVVRVLENLGIPYAVGGSMASSFHGINRNTNDADVTVVAFPGKEAAFTAQLGPNYYASIPAIQDAFRNRTSFNVINISTGFKIDLFVCVDAPFEREALRRRQLGFAEDAPGRTVFFYSPEDVILFKLRWYRLGNEVSEPQWKDSVNVLKVQAGKLDDAYLDHWAAEIGVADLLTEARAEAAEVG